MTEVTMLRDIAQVVSTDYYKKSFSGTVVPHPLKRIEYSMKVDTNSRTISNVTKSVSVAPNTVIILPDNDVDVFYIPFVIDSFYVRNGLLHGKVSVRSLSNLGIVNVPQEDKHYYCKLERILIGISLMGEDRIGYEYFYTAERLLSDLREALIFELYSPDFMHNESVRVIEHWKHEVDDLQEKSIKPFDELVELVNTMLKPGNVLFDNIKRFYLLVEKYNKG